MNQKECINVRFCGGLGIFGIYHVYREIDYQEIRNELTSEVVDIQVEYSKRFQKRYELSCIGTLGDTTRAALANAATSTETDQHFVEGRVSLDYKLPADEIAARLYNSPDKEASNPCLT